MKKRIAIALLWILSFSAFAATVEELMARAQKGDAVAQYNLGVMYDNGRGVAQSDAEALKWYRLAADQGNPFAQFNLGVTYHLGQGIAQSSAEAVKWYRLAANQGDPLAQTNLGRMYETGQGVTQDDAEAVKWYRLAADQNYPLAQNNLGRMFDDTGQDVPRNRIVAYVLYSLSDPELHRETAGAWMSKEDREMAEALSLEMQKPGNLLNALDDFLFRREEK